jgi:MarR family transcriptional regulator, lower aerobic nicotinate degradation pathway regulator
MPEIPSQLPETLSLWTTYLLRQAAMRGAQHISLALEPLGIKPPHHTIMNLISDEAQTQIGLANRTQTDRTTMVKIVDELEQYGFVTRQTNPEDRRAHHVTLTQKGTLHLEQSRAAIDQADQEFLAVLNPKEAKQFKAYLERIIAHHDQKRHRAP